MERGYIGNRHLQQVPGARATSRTKPERALGNACHTHFLLLDPKISGAGGYWHVFENS